MKKSQMAGVGVALAAGVAAYALMPSAPPPQVQTVQTQAPVIENDDVLVAASALEYGTTLGENSVRWQTWPKSSPIAGVIRKSAVPNAIAELKGSVVRGQFLADEPIRRERLVKGPSAGLMSTLVSPGKRAVAINIDSSGASSAGNFILPNDHVDILRTSRDEDAVKAGQGDTFVTETILRNVKVLAIGPNVQTENGKSVVAGSNATLELDPRQAEFIIQAQRSGQLSLVLRNMTDAIQDPAATDVQPDAKPDDRALTIIRFGIASSARAK
ncbi:MAG: Flp pilus assembly protein CpaB [Hyphomicrobiales bacterium]|nr:Flp pilus assembly protein CpaB [Hyphomicrobiales bacterium]